jgi:hypothetical protein
MGFVFRSRGTGWVSERGDEGALASDCRPRRTEIKRKTAQKRQDFVRNASLTNF